MDTCVLTLLVVNLPNDVPFDSKEGAVGFASYSRGINCNWHRSISGTYGGKGFRTALLLCLFVSNYFVFLLFLLFLTGWHVAMVTNHWLMSNAHLQSSCILSLTLSTRRFQQVEVMSTCHDLTTFSTPLPHHLQGTWTCLRSLDLWTQQSQKSWHVSIHHLLPLLPLICLHVISGK